MSSPRTETIYVLYGSQTGNSEEHAKTFCEAAATNLSASAIPQLTNCHDANIAVKCQDMQLDDFLELEQAKWPRLVVIFVSSYGVGQAPLGAYRFRDLCDYWKDHGTKHVLDGLHFALCGLGDSSYPTFFQNPQTIHDALTQAGATRVGPLGKADANIVTGDQAQPKVVQQWKDNIWKELAHVVVQEPLSQDVLDAMQAKTVAVCQQINPDFGQDAIGNTNTAGGSTSAASHNNTTMVMVVAAAVVAVGAYFVMQQSA